MNLYKLDEVAERLQRISSNTSCKLASIELWLLASEIKYLIKESEENDKKNQ